MIHNTGVYGQNEVPVNISSSTINAAQLKAPMGALSNISRYLEAGESSSSSQQHYNNHLHNTLNTTHFLQYSPNLPFNMSPIGNSMEPFYSNNVDEISNTPMNLNINNKVYNPTKQYSKKNNIDLSNFYYRKPPQDQTDCVKKSDELNNSYIKSDQNTINLKLDTDSSSKLNNNVHRKIRKRKKIVKEESEFVDLDTIKNQEVSEEVLESSCLPFVNDIHGISKDELELADYIIAGVEEAKKIVDGETELDFGTKAFNCEQCSLIFLHPKRYLIHMKWHKFGIPKERKNKKQQGRVTKRRRKKEIKVENIDLFCKECNKTFLTNNGLIVHNEKFHSKAPKECNVCQKTFPTYKILGKHKKNVHSDITSYNCPICPKTFKFPRSLQKHQDTHLEKTHSCNQCDKKFGSQLLLSIHSKTHERSARERAYHCTYCGKGYYDSYAVAAHERTHTNERPFECDICHTTFGTTSGVKRHKRVSHSTNKPYECPICHRSFSTSIIRDRHQVRYHDAPELLVFPCSHCPNRFMSNKELSKHCKQDHNTGTRTKRKRANDSNDSE